MTGPIPADRQVNADLMDLISAYCDHRRDRADTLPRSLNGTRIRLEGFARWFGARHLGDLNHATAIDWLGHARATYAPTTIAVTRHSLRMFARWCVSEGHLALDFTVALPIVPYRPTVVYAITKRDFTRTLACARNDRNRALLWLMYGCGLRNTEIARLTVEDYDDAAHAIYVTGKHGHQRRVPVPSPVTDTLATYRATLADPWSGPLVRRTHRVNAAVHLSANTINQIVTALMVDAGVKTARRDGRCPHALRALAATELYIVSKDPNIVREFLGHLHLDTLHRYLGKAAAGNLAEANDQRFNPSR